MKFGTRSADAPETGTGNYLRNWKKGENLARFLEEIDDWILVWEHYKGKKSFPCTGDQDSCPGCTHEDPEVSQAKKKYATLAYLVKQQKTFPMRIPTTLRDRLVIRSERNENKITTRDYIVIKSGAGLQTEYDVDQDERYDVDVADLRSKTPCTVQEALADSYVEVWGALPDGSGNTDETKQASAQSDVPPTDPARQSESASKQDEDTIFTEDQVRAMGKKDLQKLCDTAGLRYVSDDAKEDLVDKLLRSLSG